MKNYYKIAIILFLSFISTVAFSQKHISLGYSEVDDSGIFAIIETINEEKNTSFYGKFTQQFPKLSLHIPSEFNGDIKGDGWSIALGTRTYFSKKKMGSGVYVGGELKYSSVKFNDSRLKGKYSYLSFLSPELGYKFDIGKMFIDINAGIEWGIRLNTSGDLHKDLYDTWKPKLGIALGYKFDK